MSIRSMLLPDVSCSPTSAGRSAIEPSRRPPARHCPPPRLSHAQPTDRPKSSSYNRLSHSYQRHEKRRREAHPLPLRFSPHLAASPLSQPITELESGLAPQGHIHIPPIHSPRRSPSAPQSGDTVRPHLHPCETFLWRTPLDDYLSSKSDVPASRRGTSVYVEMRSVESKR